MAVMQHKVSLHVHGCDVLFHIVVMYFNVYIVHSTVMNHAINMYVLSVSLGGDAGGIACLSHVVVIQLNLVTS